MVGFYVRLNDRSKDTFEFTHKSFEEYLVACAALRTLEKLAQERDMQPVDKLLHTWFEFFGAAPISDGICRFLFPLIRKHPEVESFEALLGWLARTILTGEGSFGLSSLAAEFPVIERLKVQGEFALLACLSSCEFPNTTLISGYDPHSFHRWILGMRSHARDTMNLGPGIGPLNLLSHLNLEDAVFHEARLSGVTACGTNFSRAELAAANFERMNGDGAIFEEASIEDVSFIEAYLPKANFTGSTLDRTELSEISAEGSCFRYTEIRNCSMRSGRFRECDFEQSRFIEVNGSETDFSRSNFVEASIESSKFCSANFSEATLNQGQFINSLLEKVNFFRASLLQVEFTGKTSLRFSDFGEANLERASLAYMDLSGSTLKGVNLRDSDLKKAVLDDCDLSQADLRGASLVGASLRNAILREASLEYCDLREADLTGIVSTGANFYGAQMSDDAREQFISNDLG